MPEGTGMEDVSSYESQDLENMDLAWIYLLSKWGKMNVFGDEGRCQLRKTLATIHSPKAILKIHSYVKLQMQSL